MARRSEVPPSEEQIKAIRKAIKVAGSQRSLAIGIGVTAATVSNWNSGLTGVSATNAKKVAEFTNFAVKDYELSRQLKEKHDKEMGVDELSAYR